MIGERFIAVRDDDGRTHAETMNADGHPTRTRVSITELCDHANRAQQIADALQTILLTAVQRQADGGDLLDFQDTLRHCADIARRVVGPK